MDFHALQHKLFALDPSDPREDLAKLQAAAQEKNASGVPATKDYVNESVEVPDGSLPLGISSIDDFAALAGITEGRKSGGKPADQVRGSEPMPKAKPGRTKHPFKGRLVGEDDKDRRIAELEERVARLEAALKEGKKHISPSGVETDMDPSDDDYAINYGKKGGVASFRKSQGLDVKTGKKKETNATESLKDQLYAALSKYK